MSQQICSFIYPFFPGVGVSWPMNNENISFQSAKHDGWYPPQEKARPNEREYWICPSAPNTVTLESTQKPCTGLGIYLFPWQKAYLLSLTIMFESQKCFSKQRVHHLHPSRPCLAVLPTRQLLLLGCRIAVTLHLQLPEAWGCPWWNWGTGCTNSGPAAAEKVNLC